MNRGVTPGGADRTRALDTITWFISAVGPARLAERGIDPDRLMRRAADSFVVTVGGLAGVDTADQPQADAAPRPADAQRRMVWYDSLGQSVTTCATRASSGR